LVRCSLYSSFIWNFVAQHCSKSWHIIKWKRSLKFIFLWNSKYYFKNYVDSVTRIHNFLINDYLKFHWHNNCCHLPKNLYARHNCKHLCQYGGGILFASNVLICSLCKVNDNPQSLEMLYIEIMYISNSYYHLLQPELFSQAFNFCYHISSFKKKKERDVYKYFQHTIS